MNKMQLLIYWMKYVASPMITMQSWYSWRRMYQLRCQYGLVRSSALRRFSLGVSADDESRRRRRDKTRRKGEKERGRPWDGYIGGEKRGTTTSVSATEGLEKCQPANWKKGRKSETGWVKRGGWGEIGRTTSLRQPRRQINMPGRAISNIRRSRRVGASCVRTRELRWWRSTAGRIRDRLARPVAIASADRKVNGRRSARIKDPLASPPAPASSKDENLGTSFDANGLGKTWFCPLSR